MTSYHNLDLKSAVVPIAPTGAGALAASTSEDGGDDLVSFYQARASARAFFIRCMAVPLRDRAWRFWPSWPRPMAPTLCSPSWPRPMAQTPLVAYTCALSVGINAVAVMHQDDWKIRPTAGRSNISGGWAPFKAWDKKAITVEIMVDALRTRTGWSP